MQLWCCFGSTKQMMSLSLQSFNTEPSEKQGRNRKCWKSGDLLDELPVLPQIVCCTQLHDIFASVSGVE